MSNISHKLNKRKKWVIFGVLVFFSMQLVLPFAAAPRTSQALFGIGDVSITVGDIPRIIMDVIKSTLKKAGDVAFKNVLRSFLNNLAYNTATQIATGEKGQKPLFPTKPGELLKQAADVAAGDFLDELVSTWGGMGHCSGYTDYQCSTDEDCPEQWLVCPTSAIFQTGMMTGGPDMPNAMQSMQAYCGMSKSNLDQCLRAGCVIEQYSDEHESLFGESEELSDDYFRAIGYPQCVHDYSLCDFDPSLKLKLNVMARQATFGGAPAAISGRCPLSEIVDNYENIKEKAEELGWDPNLSSREMSRLYLVEISKSFNPEATEVGALLKITGETKEKGAEASSKKEFAQSITGAFNSVTSAVSGAVKTPGPLVEASLNEILGQSIGSKFVYTGSPIADAIGVFTNTLASKLMTKFLEEGLVDEKTSGGTGTGSLADIFKGISSGISAAKLKYADLQKVNYAKGGEIDILSRLASSNCSDSDNPTPDTCVIDDNFRTAIEQKLTVQEAIDQGWLDGGRIVGFDMLGGLHEPEYFKGYPYRSLLILRKYRIIPVGWELAAKYIRDYAGKNYTLNELIQLYDSPESPLYRLVDPNWVLKSPEIYCRRQGAGPQILSSNVIRNEDTNDDGVPDLKDAASTFITRQSNYCADEQMCLVENDDGTCKSFGYCIEEEPVWKFDGTDCEPQDNTCQTFTERGSGDVSYLKNTLDSEGCNAANAGCEWYCQLWDQANAEWKCQDGGPSAHQDYNMEDTGKKVTFNRNMEECNPSEGGCNEFIRMKGDEANLLVNGGFEAYGIDDRATDGLKDSADPDYFRSWADGNIAAGPLPCGDRLLAVSDTYEGLTAARITNFPGGCPASFQYAGTGQGLNAGYLTDARTFNLSFYAKRAADDPDCTGTAGQVSVDFVRYVDPMNGVFDVYSSDSIEIADSWTRYVVTHTFSRIPPGDWAWFDSWRQIFLYLWRNVDTSCDIIIDNIQFEEAADISNFKLYEDNAKKYLTVPPGYYQCSADPDVNDQICNNYAQYCYDYEVGCETYTSQTSGDIINGIVSNPETCDPNDPAACDQCPAEFVGCKAYRELPIERMPRRPARDPVSFVASTGRNCPASAEGCEEYTNLEKVAAGGEGTEYYSFIRMCVDITDTDTKIYYTWEGSDEFGYQLKEYVLKESNSAVDEDGDGVPDPGAPCTNMGAEGDPILEPLGLDWPVCIDDEDIDGDGVNDFPTANCAAADVGVNPDCGEFYDDNGLIYYRLRSRVIYASNECKSFRNSIDGPNVTYHMMPGQGAMCQASHAGCRAYKGNAGDNFRQIYREDFEEGSIDPWTGSASYSNESINAGGHSMLVNNSVAILNAGTQLGFVGGRSYEVTFWAKGGGSDTAINFAFNTTPPLAFPGQAAAKANGWNKFSLGPLFIPTNVDLSASQLLLYAPAAFYVDNIVITEVSESRYFIKDSYTECSGYENCDRYTDRAKNTHYLKSFTRLCRDDKVGCEVFIDTRNSDSPYRTSWAIIDRIEGNILGDVDDGSGNGIPDGHITQQDLDHLGNYLLDNTIPFDKRRGDVERSYGYNIDQADWDYLDAYLNAGGPAPDQAVYRTLDQDGIVFLVNDPAKMCASIDQGCERFGQPTLEPDRSVSDYTDIYLRNDPDNYANTWCYYRNHDCEEYTTPGGSKSYFRDPKATVCEFKRAIGEDVSKWYKQSTTGDAELCSVTNAICSGSCFGVCDRGANWGKACSVPADCPLGTCVGLATVGNACGIDEECAGGMCAFGFCVGNTDHGAPCHSNYECKSWNCDLVPYGQVCNADMENTCVGGPDNGNTCRLDKIYTCIGGGNDGNACMEDTHCPLGQCGDCRDPGDCHFACGNHLSPSICESRPNLVERPFNDWAGLCQAEASGCTEFRDPEEPLDYSDPENPRACNINLPDGGGDDDHNLDCQSYYYLGDSVDKTGCNGLVDRPAGCLLFNDTADMGLTYDTWDTRDKYSPSLCTVPQGRIYMRGDVTLPDGTVDIDDLAFLLAYVNGVGPAPNPLEMGDANNDGQVDMDDADYITDFIFADGPAPYPRYITSDCNSNTILKVRKDRQCKRWLECSDTWPQEDEHGDVDNLCLGLYLCEGMDDETTACNKPVEFDDIARINQTFTSPGLADKVKNYTGMILPGMDWQKRCLNNLDIICTGDLDCTEADGTPGTCSTNPQLIEGYLGYQVMQELGGLTPAGDLIEYGDFGDSNYEMNYRLSREISSVWLEGKMEGEYNGEDYINFSSLNEANSPGQWEARKVNERDAVTIQWTEESAEGWIPSPHKNLDENNVALVETNEEWTGAVYDLTSKIFSGESYVISFKSRVPQLLREADYITVQLEYHDASGPMLLNYQTLGKIQPTTDWQEFALGPVVAGFDRNNESFSFTAVYLIIVYEYDNSAGGQENKSLEFFLDDVSMKPVLEVQESKCVGGPDHGNFCRPDWKYNCVNGPNEGINCTSNDECGVGFQCGDCAKPGYCYTDNLLVRDCRLYPGSEAPYCTYTDENSTTHQGWYGYCIEPDPVYKDYCLNWWPVDLLKGEASLFKDLKEARFDDRTPLYMCMEAKGNYINWINFEDDTAGGTQWVDVSSGSYNLCVGNFGCEASSSCDNPEEVITVSGSPLLNKPFGYKHGMRTNIMRYYRAGSHADDCDGNWCGSCSTCNRFGDVENFAPLRDCDFHGIVFACDVGGGDTCTKDWNTDNAVDEDKYYKWEIDKIAVIAQIVSHNDWHPGYYGDAYWQDDNSKIINQPDGNRTADGTVFMLFDHEEAEQHLVFGNDWEAYYKYDSNHFQFKINFDENDRIESFSTYMKDGNDGGAFYALPVFYLREPCTKIAKVAHNNPLVTPKVWFDRIDSSSNFEVKDLLYSYGQNMAPFGAAVTPEDPIETNWRLEYDTGPLYAERRPITGEGSLIRAGSPYSFLAPGNSGGRQCTAPKEFDNLCEDEDKVNNCFEAGGYCVGTGVGFCQGDASFFCNEDDDCYSGGDIGPCIISRCPAPFNPIICSSNADCPGLLPCLQTGGAAGLADYKEGIYQLKRLFADAYNAWSWNYSTAAYEEPVPNTLLDSWQILDDPGDKGYRYMLPCTATEPDGTYVRNVYPDDYCGVASIIKDVYVGTTLGNMQKITGETDFYIPAGTEVHLSFAIEADKDQKPITQIEVAWGENPEETKPWAIPGNFDSNIIYLTHHYRWNNNPVTSIRIRAVDNWDFCAVKPKEDPATKDYRRESWDIGDGPTIGEHRECEWVDTEASIHFTS